MAPPSWILLSSRVPREPTRLRLAIWRRLVMDCDLAVDVGGHTGIYSIVAGLTNPKAELHTFEPHEMNFGRLLLNLRANGVKANHSHNLAASRAKGAVPFKVKINHYLSSGGSVAAEGEEFSKMVPTGPIDDHVPLGAHRACVKIDTEGHELEVLAGMQRLLGLRPDVILETAFVPAMQQTQTDLKAAGYRFFYIEERSWSLNEVECLTVPPSNLGATERENVLLTTRTAEEVRELFERARSDYRKAAKRLAAELQDETGALVEAHV